MFSFACSPQNTLSPAGNAWPACSLLIHRTLGEQGTGEWIMPQAPEPSGGGCSPLDSSSACHRVCMSFPGGAANLFRSSLTHVGLLMCV